MTPPPETVSVPIGQWAVAVAPTKIRTLLGSCVGVILHDRASRAGGLAHIVLPDSRGATEHPGKYADTAIPALVADLERIIKGKSAGRLVAKLTGGANMFSLGGAPSPFSSSPSSTFLNIGRTNQEAVERILSDLRIPVVARDLGGAAGRHVVFDVVAGVVLVRSPGAGEKAL